ncbi:hypothetical protein [Corynebacterium cystitidis]|uniref:hypothetical protein n=1 Tax=Corynebacterium cystitidis TaxID=35757 RepID=UPI00211EDE27|nr:hypothetical protein [Corynebacterium cystitidis]
MPEQSFEKLLDDKNFEETINKGNEHLDVALFASVIVLKVARLRLFADMQCNAQAVNVSQRRFKREFTELVEFWNAVDSRSDKWKAEMEELKTGTQTKLRGLQSNSKKAEEIFHRINEQQQEKSRKDFLSSIRQPAQHALKVLNEPRARSGATLVYYQDETGEHAFLAEKTPLELLG